MTDDGLQVAYVAERDAKPKELEKFYKLWYYKEGMDFDLPSILEHYILMLTAGFIMVGEEDEKLVGMLGCLVTPFQLNRNHLMCTEAMWYVPRAHSAALLLVKLIALGTRLPALSTA